MGLMDLIGKMEAKYYSMFNKRLHWLLGRGGQCDEDMYECRIIHDSRPHVYKNQTLLGAVEAAIEHMEGDLA